jgi:hypothetical protein
MELPWEDGGTSGDPKEIITNCQKPRSRSPVLILIVHKQVHRCSHSAAMSFDF